MAETLNERIDNLRRSSRLLLAQVDENSKKIKTQIKKLYSKNLILQENYGDPVCEKFVGYKSNIQSWMLRNNSSGVSGVLCPDYFCNSPNQRRASMVHTSVPKKVLMSMKKHSERQCCSENIHRKPVKECYCYPEIKKIQLRSSRTQYKHGLPCKHCKVHGDVYSQALKNNHEKPLLKSPISCETLQRVQEIDYTPKSQFLRSVQSKFSLLQNAATGDCTEKCSRLLCNHEFLTKRGPCNVNCIHQLETRNKGLLYNHQITNPRSISNIDTSLESSEEQHSKPDNVQKLDKEKETYGKNQVRPNLVIKRTLSSKKSTADIKKAKSDSKISIKSKKSHLFNKEYPYGNNNKIEHLSRTTLRKDTERSSDDKDIPRTIYVKNKQKESTDAYTSDDEVKELGKFREQNYFDTHGSSHTLVSSKSSGSLEQYLLNERLFPEPVKKIHKKDLVITMPSSATVQRRRMHYFPRYIVQQEKSGSNTNCKRKRCQGCPLTGHAIDLGITKIKPPLNSLALKYQKRLT